MIAYVLSIIAYEMYVTSFTEESMLGLGIGTIFTMVACLPTAFSLIHGIHSVKLFNACRREGKVKPIATLVLGIVGIAFASLAILYLSLGLIIGLIGTMRSKPIFVPSIY